MKLAIDIVESLLLPKLEKDSGFDSTKINTSFWETFSLALLDFESNAPPIYAAIYSLELENAEKIISKLPAIYSAFIKELAENYVLGNQSMLSTKLLESKNETFLKAVSFLTTMKAVITNVERQELKKNLPLLYDQLVFELDEETLQQVAKKKSREDLRVKFQQWDEEMVEREPIMMESSFHHNVINEAPNEYFPKRTKRKVISLSWIKYAAAACIVITAGVLYFKLSTSNVQYFSQPEENRVVTKEVPKIEEAVLAGITSVPASLEVLVDAGYGYAVSTQKINVIEKNQGERMVSIQKAIVNYQELLDKELVIQKLDSSSIAKDLASRIYSLQGELNQRKEKEKQYVFDGKSLTLFVSVSPKEISILFYEDIYYLKKGDDFYKLSVSNNPQEYKKENDSNVLKALDKIIYNNAK